MASNLTDKIIRSIKFLDFGEYVLNAPSFIDTEENWSSSTYLPKLGEIIVYDIDDNYNYHRIKIGDGINIPISLPFCFDIENLAQVAKTGKVNDLIQDEEDWFWIDCGTSTRLID